MVILWQLSARMNVTSWWNNTDYVDYVDALYAYKEFRNIFWYYSDACIFAFCHIGIISSLLTLITLCGNDFFSEPCFTCYKGVAVSELIYTITYAISRWASLNCLFPSSYSWARFNMDRQPLFDFSVSASTILIVFLSLHRAVACLLPTRYYLLNTKNVCIGMTIFAYSISMAHAMPQLFAYKYKYDNETGYWDSNHNDFGYSPPYHIYAKAIDTYRLVQGLLHFVSSTLAILGMVKAIVLRGRLFRKVSNRQQSSSMSLQGIRQNLQLCFLQLSQAIPIVGDFVFIFVVTTRWPPERELIQDDSGKVDLEYGYQWIYMWCLTDVFHCCAHCTHFYLYMIFSRKFRNGFAKRFSNIGPRCRQKLKAVIARFRATPAQISASRIPCNKEYLRH